MTVVDSARYPELRQLFGAYLNAGVIDAYGSVGAALAAYCRETGSGHRDAARRELDRLTAMPGAVTRLDAELEALGCELALPDAGAAWALAATIRRALGDGAPG